MVDVLLGHTSTKEKAKGRLVALLCERATTQPDRPRAKPVHLLPPLPHTAFQIPNRRRWLPTGAERLRAAERPRRGSRGEAATSGSRGWSGHAGEQRAERLPRSGMGSTSTGEDEGDAAGRGATSGVQRGACIGVHRGRKVTAGRGPD